MINLAIFASGSGTNAERIVEYFKDSAAVKVTRILSNKSNAFVIERAKKLNIPCTVFGREDFYESKNVISILQNEKVDLVVLAGFLWLIPISFIEAFPKTINIHPALLPKYGGKGMYGMKIHELVVKNREKETGITIHWVNQNYDEGKIILQKSVKISANDSAEDVAKKIHTLEYEFYPKAIEKIAGNKM